MGSWWLRIHCRLWEMSGILLHQQRYQLQQALYWYFRLRTTRTTRTTQSLNSDVHPCSLGHPDMDDLSLNHITQPFRMVISGFFPFPQPELAHAHPPSLQLQTDRVSKTNPPPKEKKHNALPGSFPTRPHWPPQFQRPYYLACQCVAVTSLS